MILNFSDLINRFILAIVILFVGFIIGRIFGKVLLKILHEAELNSWANKIQIKFSLEDLLSKSIELVVYIITIFLTFDQLGIAKLILYFILVFLALIIIASLILGIRDFIPNYFSGLKIKNKLKVGSSLKVGSIQGVVEKRTLIETKLRTNKGDLFLIPHSYLARLFYRR